MPFRQRIKAATLVLALATAAVAGPAVAKEPHQVKHHVDHSGRRQVGLASYYSKRFANKKTASGKRLDPRKMMAASKTLPLGTTARVTNLKNGKSAEVKVEDRGPFVPGRVLDVTPQVAEQLGMKEDGVSPVEVKPIAVPQPNGEIKQVSD